MYWMLVAILISGASVFTARTNDDNETVDTEVSVTPSQSRVGYSAWNTQVSYTHCDPLNTKRLRETKKTLYFSAQ